MKRPPPNLASWFAVDESPPRARRHCPNLTNLTLDVPFAEKTGQIVPVGRWVVVAAWTAARRFHLPVAVNVAVRQLAEPRLLENLREDWGDDDWHLLTLEITESELLAHVSHTIDSSTTVRALGARVSIGITPWPVEMVPEQGGGSSNPASWSTRE